MSANTNETHIATINSLSPIYRLLLFGMGDEIHIYELGSEIKCLKASSFNKCWFSLVISVYHLMNSSLVQFYAMVHQKYYSGTATTDNQRATLLYFGDRLPHWRNHGTVSLSMCSDHWCVAKMHLLLLTTVHWLCSCHSEQWNGLPNLKRKIFNLFRNIVD